MIPQMVLGGAMFTFDKLNKDFTSIDKVPVVAEIMPSRYIYEGLMVHQYKHNNYRKNIFSTELINSKSDFKQVYYIPEMEEILNACREHFLTSQDITAKAYKADLDLLRNEVSKELKRVPTIGFANVNKLNPEDFTPELASELETYLKALKNHYSQIFFEANNKIDLFINQNLKSNKEKFNRIKDDFMNESIEDIVRKTFDKNKILRDGDKLVQVVDPIYQIPEPEHFLDFRAHFLAPQKHFAGKYFDTLWFNIAVVWLLTTLMYLALYFDWLKKALNYMGELKLFKKK